VRGGTQAVELFRLRDAELRYYVITTTGSCLTPISIIYACRLFTYRVTRDEWRRRRDARAASFMRDIYVELPPSLLPRDDIDVIATR